MKTLTKVSVVMSVCNDMDLLGETVESVLTQSLTDMELIVINDGSSDPHVMELLEHITQNDPRCRVHNKHNEGLTAALMDGCALANGEFIARIDVGDVMHRNRLEKQLTTFAHFPDATIVSSWVEICGPRWEYLREEQGRDSGLVEGELPSPKDLLAMVDRGEIVVPHHGSVMFSRDAYQKAGGYRREFYFAQDWDLWHRLLLKGELKIIPEVLYRARLMPSGISARYRDQQMACLQQSRRWLLGADKKEQQTALNAAHKIRPNTVSQATSQEGMQAAGYYFIGEALRRNGDRRALEYLRRAIRANPRHIKAWVRYWQARWML